MAEHGLPLAEVPTGEDELGFDWGRPDERPFVRSETQARFVKCLLDGYNYTEAAKRSGYHCSTEDGYRNAGSKAAKSPSVQALLAAAKAARGETPEPIADSAECERVLSAALRSPGTSARDKATIANALRAIQADREAADRDRLRHDPMGLANKMVAGGHVLRGLMHGWTNGYAWDRDQGFAIPAKDELRHVRFTINVEPIDEQGEETARWIQTEAARRGDPLARFGPVSAGGGLSGGARAATAGNSGDAGSRSMAPGAGGGK